MFRLPLPVPAAVMLAPTLAVSGCGASDTSSSPDPEDAVAESPVDQAVAKEDPPADEPDADAEAPEEEDSYERRLTPVARIKNATDIRIEGKHAWVTVPVDSSSASSVLECLHLLPAVMPDETLTVIYSDGVEELCEWPEEE